MSRDWLWTSPRVSARDGDAQIHTARPRHFPAASDGLTLRAGRLPRGGGALQFSARTRALRSRLRFGGRGSARAGMVMRSVPGAGRDVLAAAAAGPLDLGPCLLVTRIVRVTFLPTRVPLTGAAFLGLARPSAAFRALSSAAFTAACGRSRAFSQHGSALVRGLGRRRLDLRRLLLGRLGGRHLLRGFLGGRLLGLRERDDTCRVDREGRASDARTRSRDAREFGSGDVRSRGRSVSGRGRSVVGGVSRAHTRTACFAFSRGGGFLLRPRLLRALGGGSGRIRTSASEPRRIISRETRESGPAAARTCLMISSRETSILVGASTAPMVKPPRESPSKAIARAGRRA